jgi:dynein heavy chain 1
MIEETQGMKVNMEYNLSLCRPYKGPKEFCRISFLICWIHTIILERTKYLPIGWTSNYSFSDSDLLLALQITGDWISKFAAGKRNVSPDSIPWKAIRALIGGIYGDKMDRNTDVRILESMIKYFLKPEMFDEKCKINFPIGEGSDILVPKGTEFTDFKAWLLQLDQESLNLIGFEEDMNIIVNMQQGNLLCT